MRCDDCGALRAGNGCCHREARFQVNALGADAREVDRHWTRIRPHLAGIYLPFETDQHPARLGEVFPPATIERLRALKRELDPRNLFRDNFNVDPGGTTTDAAPAATVPG